MSRPRTFSALIAHPPTERLAGPIDSSDGSRIVSPAGPRCRRTRSRGILDAAPDPEAVLELDLDDVVVCQSFEADLRAARPRALQERRVLDDDGSLRQASARFGRLWTRIANPVDL